MKKHITRKIFNNVKKTSSSSHRITPKRLENALSIVRKVPLNCVTIQRWKTENLIYFNSTTILISRAPMASTY